MFGLWFKTQRKTYKSTDLFNKLIGTKYELDLGDGKNTVVYEWGQGPVALLVHGWNGQAVQFYETIQMLINKGYKVIAFDAPGHGLSAGNRSDLPSIVQALKIIGNRLENIELLIGHSLGGLAIGRFIADGGIAKNVLLISTPKSIKSVVEITLNSVGLSASAKNVFKKLFTQAYSEKVWENYDISNFKDGFTRITDVQILHDKRDKLIPISHARNIHKSIQNSKLTTTFGLGHRNILNSDDMLKIIESFS